MDTSQQPLETIHSPTPANKSRKGLVIAVIVLSFLLLGTWGAAAWLYASGKVTVWETKAPVANVNAGLCQNLIASYNKVFIEATDNEFAQTLEQTATKAKAADPSESDATCVYMRYTNVSTKQDTAEMLRLANVLKALASQGEYMTAELANPQGIDTIMYTVQPPESNSDAPARSGEG
jgi:hypothetical protein